MTAHDHRTIPALRACPICNPDAPISDPQAPPTQRTSRWTILAVAEVEAESHADAERLFVEATAALADAPFTMHVGEVAEGPSTTLLASPAVRAHIEAARWGADTHTSA